jgi:hypothetical protein
MPDPVLTASQIADLQVSTRPDQNPMQIVDISDDLQDYVFAREVLRKGKTKTVTGGRSFTWRVMVNDSGSARDVGLAYEDETSQVDVLTEASADWRHSEVNHSEIKQVLQMNQGDDVKLVDLDMLYEKAALKSWVAHIESRWFGPPVAVTDTVTPWGMATWIVKNAVEGFNGGNPSGYSSIGLNSDDFPNWKNWTALYSNITDEDFIRKLHKALLFTDFKPAVDGLPLMNKGQDYMQFSNYGLIRPLEEYLKASNENLGVDIAKYANSVVINRRPVVWVPYLEADTTNPFYFIRMADVFLYRLKNFWMRKTELPNLPGRHNVKGTWFDFTWQNVFVSRRGSGVIATGTTYPT